MFRGFNLYTSEETDSMINPLSALCRTALTQRINCHSHIETFARLQYYGSLGDNDLTTQVCAPKCGECLHSWFENVRLHCGEDGTHDDGSALTLLGGRMLSAYHQTCLEDPSTGHVCNGRGGHDLFLSHIHAANNKTFQQM